MGKTLIEHQAVNFRLADMATGVEAARQLYLHAAQLRDAGQPCLKEASMAKLFASEAAERSARTRSRSTAATATCPDFPVERIWRDVRSHADLRRRKRHPAARHRPRARHLIREHRCQHRSISISIFPRRYGYLASRRIDALARAHGRKSGVAPILLGVAFKATGGAPLPSIPIRARTRCATSSLGALSRHSVSPADHIPGLDDLRGPRVLLAAGPRSGSAVELGRRRSTTPTSPRMSTSRSRRTWRRSRPRLGVDAQRARRRAQRSGGEGPDEARRSTPPSPRASSARRTSSSMASRSGGMDRLDQVERWLAKGPFYSAGHPQPAQSARRRLPRERSRACARWSRICARRSQSRARRG